MSLRSVFVPLYLLFYSSITIATPPFEVMFSCRDSKAYSGDMKMTEMHGESVGDYAGVDPGCETQRMMLFENKFYGSTICADKDYLIVNSKNLNVGEAQNNSSHPDIVPVDHGGYLHHFSDFW